jgi:uncharacterized OsmC-like protein
MPDTTNPKTRSLSGTVVHEFTIEVDRVEDYRFRVAFDKPQYPELALDEPSPLGRDTAPNATRILAAAVGNCLSASLLFCAGKAKIPIDGVHARVRTKIVRNERGRLRVGSIQVVIEPRIAPEHQEASKCLNVFEDFCTVTESVRAGIPVDVTVRGWEA